MSNEKSKPGRDLERRVADAYRAMGAREVGHDIELAGNQIDVYVEMESADRSLHRIAVEVKDWRRPVGIDVINKFVPVVENLRGARLVDEGVIVSASGFSKQARNAAQTYGIRLRELDDLLSSASPVMVEVVLNVDLSRFSAERQDSFLNELAGLLQIGRDEFRVLNVMSGSTRLVLEMPREAAERLVYLYEQEPSAVPALKNVSEITITTGDRDSCMGAVLTKPRGEQVGGVRFVNREYELRRICTLNGAQFTLIDAPAGYGKSYLLHEVKRQLCDIWGGSSHNPRIDGSGTRCALIEFGDRLALERQVLDAICEQMDIPPESVTSTDDLAPEFIAMAERSGDQAHKLTTVMLMFDKTDQIRVEGVKTWLVRDLIAGLDRGLDAPRSGIKLRAVLAGRFIASEWDTLGKQHALKFMLLPLSPFSRDIVEEALRLKAQEVGQSLEPPAYSGMARGIVRVTGGHPRCMSQVIDLLAEKRFGVNYEGPESYFDRIHLAVFRNSVRPVVDALVEKLEDGVSELMSRISVFRRFDQRILDILINSGEIEGFASGEEALATLNDTALITPPGIVETEKRYEHLHTDRIARRLLALSMRVEDPKLYSRLNSIARHIFRAWLEGKNIESVPREGPPIYAGDLPNKPKDHLQVALVQEYLYHCLQSIETLNERDLEQDARRLYHELDSSLGAYDIPNQRGRLRDALEADWELEDRTYYLACREKAGETLWNKIIEWGCGLPM